MYGARALEHFPFEEERHKRFHHFSVPYSFGHDEQEEQGDVSPLSAAAAAAALAVASPAGSTAAEGSSIQECVKWRVLAAEKGCQESMWRVGAFFREQVRSVVKKILVSRTLVFAEKSDEDSLNAL